jgi:hypothetical protein
MPFRNLISNDRTNDHDAIRIDRRGAILFLSALRQGQAVPGLFDGDGTMLTLRHEQLFDEATRDGHQHGWNGALDKLEKFVA